MGYKVLWVPYYPRDFISTMIRNDEMEKRLFFHREIIFKNYVNEEKYKVLLKI